jgi:hypothetical protein
MKRDALTYAQPTTRLAARCRGSTLAVHHPDGKIGGTAWFHSSTFTGLATSNVGRRRLPGADNPRHVGRSHSIVAGVSLTRVLPTST